MRHDLVVVHKEGSEFLSTRSRGATRPGWDFCQVDPRVEATPGFEPKPLRGTNPKHHHHSLRVLNRLHQPHQRVFRVAIQHARYRFKKQRVLQTGEAFALPALQDHD